MTPHPFTAPTGEVVLAQFGPRLYVALRSATLRVGSRPEVVEWGDHPTVVSDTLLAILSCPCGAELEVELHTAVDNAATIARYCLPAGHCTFIRLPTPQPPCEHWQPIPIELGDLRRRLNNAETRIELARNALIGTGYFTADQVSDDIAPRITELNSHYTEPDER